MGRRAANHDESTTRKLRPAITPEAEENQMISLAIEQAKKQLMEGTASSQIVCHYLKLASPTEKLSKQIAEQNLELLKAKTEAYKSAKRMEELYEKAINAIQSYAYNPGGE